MPTIDQKAAKQSWKVHPSNDLDFTGRIKVDSVLQDLTLGWDIVVTLFKGKTQLGQLTIGAGIELSLTLGEFNVTIDGMYTVLLNNTSSITFDLDITNPLGVTRTFLVGTILSDIDNPTC